MDSFNQVMLFCWLQKSVCMKTILVLLLLAFAVQYAAAQEVVHSSKEKREVQQQAERFSYRAGYGAGYNQLQAKGSNFGFEILATLNNELEWKQRLRAGLMASLSLAGVKQTVLLNNGRRFDKDRAPTGAVMAPYAALVLVRTERFTVAPQIGFQWHFFTSEDSEQPDSFQAFTAKGADYALAIDYQLPNRQNQTRKRSIRVLLNYARLNINGQPAIIEMYGMQVQVTLRMFKPRIGS